MGRFNVPGMATPVLKTSIRQGFHDYEYSTEYLANDRDVATPEDAGTDYSHFIVWAPACQPISLEHLFPLHGQFADWEMGNKPYPMSTFERHPGPL